MRSLRIIRAKPNPWGKDRVGGYMPPAQLAAEWVDVQNDGDEAYALEPVILCHVAFQPGCRDLKWDQATDFKGTLLPGKAMRVHSGEPITIAEMHSEDAVGVDYHVFTGRRAYVWNNSCGDTAALWDGKTFEDKATYDPYPPEGAILRRAGDKLVP